MSEPATAVDLVRQAFSLARKSGKPDWWVMTIPVLKNRLLLLTKGSFKEVDYGATSFRNFLSKISDAVRIDETQLPGLVTLLSEVPSNWQPPSVNKFRGERVRPDLWLAVLDYSSGAKYIWDDARQIARAAKSGEVGLELPTISPTEIDEWRNEFIKSQKSLQPDVVAVVEEWSKKGLPTAGLPAPLRPVWNKFLKRKVERRIQTWFEANALVSPTVMEVGRESSASDNQLAELREFIVSCINIMSAKELQDLRISPSVAMRMMRANRPSDENER